MKEKSRQLNEQGCGIGEKVSVLLTPLEKVDIPKIKQFYELLPQSAKDEILVLGVANFCLQSQDEEFLRNMHKALFPQCYRKKFVRYE